jgi:hypothetical protein
MSITIDSTTYDVPIVSISRKADSLDKGAERTQDGVLHRELIGIYFNYDLTMGMSANNVADYAALFLKLTEPTEYHTVVIPGAPAGYETVQIYFGSIRDEMMRYQLNGVDYFRSLSFSIIARAPSRTP